MIIKNSLIILDKSTQFDDFEILSSNNVKVIAIDYETHQKLEKKNISHDLLDDYLEKNQREKLYDYVLTKYTWYDKLSRKKDFEYNNINILSLMSPLELHEFLLIVCCFQNKKRPNQTPEKPPTEFMKTSRMSPTLFGRNHWIISSTDPISVTKLPA